MSHPTCRYTCTLYESMPQVNDYDVERYHYKQYFTISGICDNRACIFMGRGEGDQINCVEDCTAV